MSADTPSGEVADGGVSAAVRGISKMAVAVHGLVSGYELQHADCGECACQHEPERSNEPSGLSKHKWRVEEQRPKHGLHEGEDSRYQSHLATNLARCDW